MTNTLNIVNAAGDREAAVCDAIAALQDAEGTETHWRETAQRRRVELGRALLEVRKLWPKAGRNAKGWGELLARVKLEERTAERYMQLAGYVAENPEAETAPTYAEAGIDRRSTADDPSPERDADVRELAASPRPGAGVAPLAPSAVTLAADGGEHATGQNEGPGPDRDAWCTPERLAKAIGPIDLDPCSNDRSHVRAAKKLQIERGEDGLAMAKFVAACKRVFINPPYSRGQVILWILAYLHTRFVFLLRLDPSTRWFCEVFIASQAIAVPKLHRVNFEPPPGVTDPGVRFPHALFYALEEDITPEVRAMCFIWRITDEDREEAREQLKKLKETA